MAAGQDSGKFVGLAAGMVVAAALISGVSTFVNFYAVQGTNSDAFVSTRNLVTALMLVPIAFLSTRALRTRLAPADWGKLALIGLIGGAIPFLLFFRGIELATAAGGAAAATYIYRTLFIMATVFGIVFLHEKFRFRFAFAASLLLVGNILLLSFFTPLWTAGMGYVLAATLLWAVEYTISRRVLRDLPSSTVALGRMGFGAIFLFAYLALTAQIGAIAAMNGSQWMWLGISALLLTAFVATWYAGLKGVEVGVATSVLVMGFPVTWLLAVFFHGTPYTVAQVAGAVIVGVGVAFALGRQFFEDLWSQLARIVRPRPSA